mgnify:CR=1 FL=1
MPVTIPTTQERIILGIDPGTTIMGYGVLRIVGNNPQLMTMGVLQLGKMGDHYLKLKRIFERVLGLIEQYHPDEMAIEAPLLVASPTANTPSRLVLTPLLPVAGSTG